MTMIRKPPTCARPRLSGRARAATGTTTEADTSRPEGRECGAHVGPGGDTSGGSRPVRREVPAPPPDTRGDDLDAWLASIMEATGEEDSVARVFGRMSTALWELDELLTALGGDGRVSPEYRRALAAGLDYIASAHLQEWQSDLLESLDVDEG